MGKPTILDLFKDLFDALFNIDNKLFRTLKKIILPGQLTIDYFKGIRGRYLTPVRFFLPVAIIFFAVFNYSVSDEIDDIVNSLDTQDTGYRDLYYERFDTTVQSIERRFPEDRKVDNTLDMLQKQMDLRPASNTSFGGIKFLKLGGFTTYNISIARRDLLTMDIDELMEEYDQGNFFSNYLLKQNIRLNKDPESFARYLLGLMIWTVITTILFISVFMKLIYIRRKRFLVEHAVFSLHTQSFVFLVLILVMLLNRWTDWEFNFLALGIFVYVYMAMFRYYGQGWFKTLIKFFFLIFSYFILFFFAFMFTILIGVILF
ncbi:MAG: DUF3667 domain-containing protein [Bacteroidota bacterium]